MEFERNRLGYCLSLLVAGLTLLSFLLAIFGTPSYTYPYPYTPPFILNDFVWLIPAFILMPVLIGLVALLHVQASKDERIFSLIALSFTIICATVLVTDYFIQWAVVIPSTLKGETQALSLVTQYNPHGLFVALESLGYLMMSAAFLSLAPLFKEGKTQTRIRWLFVIGFILTVVSFVAITVAGQDIVDFEVIAIFVNWTVLIVTGLLLARLFGRKS